MDNDNYSLRENCSSPPHSLYQSAEVESSFPFVNLSSGERTQGHNNLKRFSFNVGVARGTPQRPIRSFPLQPGPQLTAFAKPSFQYLPPTLPLNYSDMCVHCLAPLRKHRPLRQNIQTWSSSSICLGPTVHKGPSHPLSVSLFGSNTRPPMRFLLLWLVVMLGCLGE